MKLAKFVALLSVLAGWGGAAMCIARNNSEERSSASMNSMPAGYRDWTLISVAHEEGNLNDIRAILGNRAAAQAFRSGKSIFPDGSIIARIAWRYVPSDENNKAFGKIQSFVAGDPTNVQFMVKDSARYSATGGWGFAQFARNIPTKIDAKVCFSCHEPIKGRDFVFTHYSQ